MGKRNQYNRSTFPQDVTAVLYNTASAQVSPTGSFTINADAGMLVYLPVSGTFTGSIDVVGMRNGQRLELVLPGQGFLLSSSVSGGNLLAGAGFANTSSLSGSTTYVCYKVDTADIGSGPVSNVLLLASSASYTGFA
jgi:hypothetical protein